MESDSHWRSVKKGLVVVLGVAVLVALNAFALYHQRALPFQPVGKISEEVARNGPWNALILALPLLLAYLVSYLVIPLTLLGAIVLLPFVIRKKRYFGLFWALVFTAVIFAEATGAFLVHRTLYKRTFDRVFTELADRSQVLIDAIEQYKAVNGEYPSDLESMVPQFLKRVPDTGLAGYPRYEYKITDAEYVDLVGSYEILVHTPSGGLNWDVFVYWPSGKYPEYFYGGLPQFFGKWAYVHE